MRDRFGKLAPVLVYMGFFLLMALAVAGPSLAQKEAQKEKDKEPGFEAGVETAGIKFDVHDLSGIYRSVAGGLETIGGNVPSMTPVGMKVLSERISADRVESPSLSNDPQFKCDPQGFPRLWLDHEVIENVHLEGRLLQLSQWEQTLREIWMDGRALPTPEDLKVLGEQYYGYSVGRWERDTLVVDTVGLNDKNWIDDNYGFPISNEARMEERYRRVGPDVISVQYTLYDPKYYTAPWVGDIKPWRRMPRAMSTHLGWFGLFSGTTEAICAPVNEESYHQRNAPAYNLNQNQQR